MENPTLGLLLLTESCLFFVVDTLENEVDGRFPRHFTPGKQRYLDISSDGLRPRFQLGGGIELHALPAMLIYSGLLQRMLKDAIPEKKTSWQSCLQSRAADPWTDVFDPTGCCWRCRRHTEMPLKTRKQRSFIPLMVCHFNEQHIINRRIDALWWRIRSHHSLHIYIPFDARTHMCLFDGVTYASNEPPPGDL